MSKIRALWNRIYSPMILSLSIRNLKLNKFRTMLSLIGIIIGVISICGLGMIGGAFTENINMMVAENADRLTLSSIEEKNVGGTIVYGFSEKDVNEIESAVKQVTTEYEIITQKTGTKPLTVGKSGAVGYLTAMNEVGLEEISKPTLEEGSIPRSANGVLITRDYADDNNLHINSRITTTDVNGEEVKLRVTGILEEDLMTFVMSMSQDMCMITGSLDMYQNILGDKNNLYDSVIVKVKDPLLLNPIEDAIERKMNGKAYKDSDDTVRISNSYDTADTLNDVLSLALIFRTVISAISLIVASVAIVNVMMMSVKERTKEIGILRSIGTKKSQILQMFLYEAGIMGLIGSFIGTVWSCILTPIVLYLMFGSIELMFTFYVLSYIPIGIFIGVSVCILAGLYPALKAANLNPVEAMATD